MAVRAAEAAAALQAEPLRAANRARALLGALRAPGDGRGEDGAAAGIAAEALGGYLAVMERTGYLGPRRRGREAPIDAEADGAGGGARPRASPPRAGRRGRRPSYGGGWRACGRTTSGRRSRYGGTGHCG